MQLNNIIQYQGQIELLTGLHIGSGDAEMKIGGIDSTVIKHPYTNDPYIPGSSLKGKMRHLLEWSCGVINRQGKPASYSDYSKENDPDKKQQIKTLLQLFGISGDSQLNDEASAEMGMTRLSFWDCMANNEWLQQRSNHNQLKTESKSENVIDRIRGTAGNPRFIERVPAGALFDFRLNLKVTDKDDSQALKAMLFRGLKLLEMDAIGGSGSRGYGKIRFINLTEDGQDIQEQLQQYQAFTA